MHTHNAFSFFPAISFSFILFVFVLALSIVCVVQSTEESSTVRETGVCAVPSDLCSIFPVWTCSDGSSAGSLDRIAESWHRCVRACACLPRAKHSDHFQPDRVKVESLRANENHNLWRLKSFENLRCCEQMGQKLYLHSRSSSRWPTTDKKPFLSKSNISPLNKTETQDDSSSSLHCARWHFNSELKGQFNKKKIKNLLSQTARKPLKLQICSVTHKNLS